VSSKIKKYLNVEIDVLLSLMYKFDVNNMKIHLGDVGLVSLLLQIAYLKLIVSFYDCNLVVQKNETCYSFNCVVHEQCEYCYLIINKQCNLCTTPC